MLMNSSDIKCELEFNLIFQYWLNDVNRLIDLRLTSNDIQINQIDIGFHAENR